MSHVFKSTGTQYVRSPVGIRVSRVVAPSSSWLCQCTSPTRIGAIALTSAFANTIATLQA